MSKDNLRLVSKSSREWVKFISDGFYPLDIISTAADFSGEVDIVKYDDDFRFASVKSSSQEVKSEVCDEFFYLISTINPIRWFNGIGNGCLNNGGIVIFDCTKEMKYKFPESRVSNSFLIPYHYFKNGSDIDLIKHGGGLLYQDMIYQLLEGIHVDNHSLLNRMHTIANLLTINDPIRISDDSIQLEFDIIKEFIHINAKNPNLSLDYMASQLLISRSKIQAILGKNGTNYTTLIKQARVNKLANSIKHNMTTSLYQLCFEHGYKSISSASAQFKSVKGMSLKQYRDIIRG
ncbi:helix-turn-helix domain-containing protein [Photobacterium damselae]|uniref:helix-turn-helix domain-containing protein n=1 Tax=Photobacterium damselae TaxID=38293 RepID=UPI004068C76C